MKLLDILARELKVWPDDLECAHQDHDGEIRFYGGKEGTTRFDFMAEEKAHDRCVNRESRTGSRITRAEWQSAVDALKAPKVVEWDGEDTPAVGVICEFHESTSGWNSAVVKYSSDHCVVLERDNGYELCIFTVFPSRSVRPIRTAEQVSAEEREKAINLMIDDTSILTGTISDRRTMARQLYDAGYRKEQKPCGS